VYALGINNNEITYSDLLPDTPSFGEWPQNYNRLNEGDVTVAYAIRQSKNTTAVRLVETLGLNPLSALLREKFHFTSLSKDDDSLQGIALGYLKGGVSLEELALAYQIFGNGGLYYEGSYFTKVAAFDGTVIFNSPNVAIPIVDSQTAGILNRLLRSNVILPDGMGINADMYGIEVIGKTGTTDNSHGISVNTLFVGATPSYIGAVWVGSDNQGVNRINGAFPQTTEVWRRVMERISHEKITFDIDRTLIVAEFCIDTGLISDSCKNIEQGWYKPDNFPKTCTCTR
jgi:penicillin-binding protein 1A